ncbi:MAG TPA: 3-dehydroquinate synthase [Humisphaera sp.]
MTAERTIRLSLQGHAYDIVVRPGLLADAGAKLRPILAARKAVVVTDTNIPPATVAELTGSLSAAGFEPHVVTVPAGEDQKLISTVVALFDRILPLKVDRQTPVIALGGGVIGDMAGFVAATLLRGVPFVQCPTSLLAMVDASVGGKTGVNHPTGKNLIGAFHQPVAVLADTETLRTLPEAELRGGLAECIKHDLIRDAEGFARLEREIGRALSLDLEYLTDLVAHNVAIKARVVEADPFEKGERAHLNLGHTFGHAIENVSEYGYSHGQAVALGTAAAAKLCVSLGLLDEPARQRILAVIRKAGLPVDGMTLDREAVVAAMAFDKKAKAGKLRFVLLDGIGRAVVRDDVPVELVRDAVAAIG